MLGRLCAAMLFCLIGVIAVEAADQKTQTVIYGGAVTEVASNQTDSPDLWVTLKDLTRATGFVLKPQGVCLDELCFPIPKARKKAFLQKQGKVDLFNLAEFARLLKQPFANDEKHGVWFFGPRPDVQNGFLDKMEAPDFTLPDSNGRMRSLSEFRGKKVLLITWASW